MRIGRQTVAARLLAEVVEVLLAEPAVEEGAGVDAGGGVALDVELVAGAVPSLPRKKWLKPVSYSQAAEAKVAMWPPTPCRAPRVTIAAAFQRFQAVIRDSISRSPSNAGSAAVGMELT